MKHKRVLVPCIPPHMHSVSGGLSLQEHMHTRGSSCVRMRAPAREEGEWEVDQLHCPSASPHKSESLVTTPA
jgi:hypothetical protein